MFLQCSNMDPVSQPFDTTVMSDLNRYLKSLNPNPIPLEPQHVCKNSSCVQPDRFLVNLFEKPKPQEQRRVHSSEMLNKRVLRPNNNDKLILTKKKDKSSRFEVAMEQYELKNLRDVQCIKMKEASIFLEHLNKISRYGYWTERLLVEKILLECDHAIEILRKQIQERYVYDAYRHVTIGTMSIRQVNFYLNQQHIRRNETEFYVLLISNHEKVQVSDITRVANRNITFDEEFSFKLKKDFKIKVQLYCIKLQDPSKFGTVLLKKSYKRIFKKIRYKNLNTSIYEETNVLRSSFELCAETEINSANVHNKAWELILTPNSTLSEFVDLSTNQEFQIEFKHSGFLTFGLLFKEAIVWNRRWCVLDGTFLKIYASPFDEEIREPLSTIDLQALAQPIDNAPESLCSRPRTLMISVAGKESVENYFFMADCTSDFETWLTELNFVWDLIQSKDMKM